MKLFLAGTLSGLDKAFLQSEIEKGVFRLDTFARLDTKTLYFLNDWSDFLLDSGAFTYFSDPKNKGNIDWDNYIDKYASFILKHNIKLFFELDIDSLIGYERVKKMRFMLEKKVGRQCIPVWHKSRGLEDFKKMCDDYSYVAIGGLVTKEIKKADYKILQYLVSLAHSKNAKIHGLGFTITDVKKFGFDSVDSSSWNVPLRTGAGVYRFFDKKLNLIKAPAGSRSKCYKQASKQCFSAWADYARFLYRQG